MIRIKVFSLCIVLAALTVACGSGGVIRTEPQATETPTPPMIGEPVEVFHPVTGLITLEFLDAETQLACTADFPFSLNWKAETAVIAGLGEINCPLTTQQCGEACITYHIEYLYEGDLSGNVNLAVDPGQLQAELILDGSLTQYWTDIPPDSLVAFTEEHPMVLETADILTLVFDFEDGAVFKIENTNVAGAPPWVFTLHLGD